MSSRSRTVNSTITTAGMHTRPYEKMLEELKGDQGMSGYIRVCQGMSGYVRVQDMRKVHQVASMHRDAIYHPEADHPEAGSQAAAPPQWQQAQEDEAWPFVCRQFGQR